MRIYFILGALVIFIGSSSFAEPVSKHEATEEVMQYMKAHKALETAKFGVWSLFENMREAAVDKGAQTDEERSIEKKYFQKVNELIDREVTWEAVRPAFIGVFEEVFTESEINGLLFFFKSPAGKAYIEKFPILTRKLVEASQKETIRILPGLEKLEEEMKHEMKGRQDKK
ncbi:MAG: hypothetical protein XU12_C0008G0024 [Deltaproteobacteria bacterium CSP1-8]|nr:MAG: hypothetical protein XU12_C0008G0024 [Deltaproteobacteria bacterium CSP1-8]